MICSVKVLKCRWWTNVHAYVSEGGFVSDNNEEIRRDDIIGVKDSPSKIEKGELSIIPKKVIEVFTGCTEWDYNV